MGTPMITKKKAKLPGLSFSSTRRFGVEFEYNSFDKKNRPEAQKRVAGIETIANVVSKFCEQGVEIRDWEHTNNNNKWVVKPDSSCGLEVVTPPLKGWRGLMQTCRVVDGVSNHPDIQADHRCSVHVHLEVADLTDDQLASVFAHWIKCEPVFMDMMPPQRKRNRYCQFVGLSNKFQLTTSLNAKQWIAEVGDVKYYSLNCNQMRKAIVGGNHDRKTIEFRIGDPGGCKDAFYIKNWVRLLIHFVEMCKLRAYPNAYEEGKPPKTNGLVWLDPEDVLSILGFGTNPQQHELSNGLQQTRNWMLSRLQKNMTSHEFHGYPRSVAFKQLQEILNRLKEDGEEINPSWLVPEDMAEALYNEKYKY
jgi:hypothetical protein